MDKVVTTARRRRLLQRLAVAGATGGTAFAAVGVIAALALTTAGPAASSSAPSPTPTQAQSTPPDGAAPVRHGETREQTSERLAAALTNGLTAALPGVHIANGPNGQAGVVVFFDQNLDRNLAWYNTDSVLTTDAGHSELALESWSGGRVPVDEAPTDWPSDQPAPPILVSWFESCADVPTSNSVTAEGYRIITECDDSVGPDGQKIVALTERCPDCPQHPTLRHDVYVTWTNARVSLSIMSETKRGDPNESRLAAPLLTREQLIAIAIDPDLTVTS